MVDFNGFDKGVIGKKLPSDSTLNQMKKSELIELLHLAESNHRVLAAGLVAINPAKVNAQLPVTLTHAEYMKTSIAMLDMCEAIYMMDGWQQSKGCEIEFEYAYEHGITIYFENGRVAIEDIIPKMNGFMMRRFMETQ